ncbi:MAG: sugar ABC transporter ATP-binding protein [Spirochaetaceae bacterium]|nr:sugar ABC transporter ATP-binding protein [Spirochaetaceae bacterium]
MNPSRPLLELKNIHKHFVDFHLDEVDIVLNRGEVHVLIGENGSGKSTLMKLISGWFPPDGGAILYRGEPVQFRSIHEAQRNGIIYLHQDVQSFNNLSVAENVFFGRIPTFWGVRFFVDLQRMLAKCQRLFAELKIPIDPSASLGNLGYAERQLVAAARGYVSAAELVIFDEPTSAMSEPERNILFDILNRLKENGTGIFYISHRMDEIRRIGNRVSVIHKGRIRGTEECDSVDKSSLLKMMSGDVLKNRYPRIGAEAGPVVMKVKDIVLMPILKGVDFHLRRGEILGITGLMGSGRTLLANCLFGIVRPENGQVEINGEKVSIRHPIEAMSRGISLIPEDRAENGMFLRHNLIQNITAATLPRFRSKGVLNDSYMRELTQDYVREMSIKPGNTGDIMETYSGGNQQKVMVSRWLMNRSRIYIMDEPTRGIDAASKVDIYNAMNDMVDKGASIILISSEIEEILGMSDRILVLAGGRIAAEMNSKNATKEKILDFATDEE